MTTWNHDISMVDKIAAANHAFITKLWGKSGPKLREDLFKAPDKESLKTLLEGELRLEFPQGIQFILIDIEGAQTKSLPDPIVKTDPWYALVMPPVPTRSKDGEYKALQLWSEASFHASNDGYGM